MRMIKIDPSILPRGYYARDVAEYGHVPGILSGSNLRGNAREWSGWYARMRGRVAKAVYRATGACQGYRLINSRWCKVWTDGPHGKPVQLIITEGE